MTLKVSVFYFDDDPVCLGTFADMFSDRFDVRTAATLEAARRTLSERPADIIISDQRMPEIEGTEFLREVADAYPMSFRVLLTGQSMVGDVIREISTGIVNLFMTKPWTERDMSQMLERACAAVELRRRSR